MLDPGISKNAPPEKFQESIISYHHSSFERLEFPHFQLWLPAVQSDESHVVRLKPQGTCKQSFPIDCWDVYVRVSDNNLQCWQLGCCYWIACSQLLVGASCCYPDGCWMIWRKITLVCSDWHQSLCPTLRHCFFGYAQTIPENKPTADTQPSTLAINLVDKFHGKLDELPFIHELGDTVCQRKPVSLRCGSWSWACATLRFSGKQVVVFFNGD